MSKKLKSENIDSFKNNNKLIKLYCNEENEIYKIERYFDEEGIKIEEILFVKWIKDHIINNICDECDDVTNYKSEYEELKFCYCHDCEIEYEFYESWEAYMFQENNIFEDKCKKCFSFEYNPSLLFLLNKDCLNTFKNNDKTMLNTLKVKSYINYSGHFLHNEEGPAYTLYQENGRKKLELYCKDGYLHSIDNPSVIKYHHPSNSIWLKIYYQNGKRHRDNEPALFQYYYNQNIKKIEYYQKNILHNEDGFASIDTEFMTIQGEDVKVTEKICYQYYNITSSNDKPAITYLGDNGMFYHKYLTDGYEHRINGPSLIGYSVLDHGIDNGEGIQNLEAYYLKGQEFTKSNYFKILKLYKNKTKRFKLKKRNNFVQKINENDKCNTNKNMLNVISEFII